MRKGSRVNRFVVLVMGMLVVGLLVGLTTTAMAGAGNPGATVAKKKKKKVCAPGTHKVVIKKKNGKKKKTCVPDVVTPTAPTAPVAPTPTPTTTLAITPGSFLYQDVDHGACTAPPDMDCEVKTFTVTNTGSAPSGVPATTIVETNNPIPGDPPGFVVDTNTCTAALPPAGSCTVGVYFKPTSNASPQPYTAVLHVAATPGSDVQATLTGTGT
jgi:hypothetical protein